jgi:exonuclease SbcC
MILKALTVDNIRSYKSETRVDFPVGITLFEGDIASGKSTLLYAIEFGLFGLGQLRGSFLLRNGAKQGTVVLEFETDGRDYEVHRTLTRKGKTVQQVECFLRGPKGKAPMAATELKERILQILKFNEPPNPRAQSVIYRYAIFTPQEEMKEVILKNAEDRLQTLRRAFGIEEYKIAFENSLLLVSKVRNRVSYLEGTAEDLEGLRAKLKLLKESIEKLDQDLGPLKKQEAELRSELGRKRELRKELEGKREKIRKAEERIPLLERQIADKTKQSKQLLDENTTLERRAGEEIAPKITALKKIHKPTDKTKLALKKSIVDMRKKSRDGEKLKAKLEERIGNFESIVTKKKCPVCERPIDPKEFRGKGKHLEIEIEKLESESKRLEREISAAENLQDELTGYESARSELEGLNSQVEEMEQRVARNKEKLVGLDQETVELQVDLQSSEAQLRPLEAVLNLIETIDAEIAALGEDLEKIGRKIATSDQEIRSCHAQIRETDDQIALKENQLKIRDKLNEQKMWLNNYFSPTVESIEKHVMAELNAKFNQQLQKWFQILIEDPELQVRVDEGFTPIVERGGYEQEYIQLSGGERTSVALAYRLALNTTVQEVSAGGGSGLLILDEPTDGFSREQLFKIREILGELRCPQVIMVSHERELEGFSDHVFKIEKIDGNSQISALK